MKIILMVVSIAVLAYLVIRVQVPLKHSGVTVHLAGDSTMSEQTASKRPGMGWGEPLASMLCDGVRVLNQAESGRSTKSYLSEGHWQSLVAQLQPGDIVLIQFGHNDQKMSDLALYASAWQDYQENLQRFVLHVRDLDAKPILLTSIVRRVFDSKDELVHTLGDYPAVTRNVAAEMKVDLIDLNAATHELIENLGPSESKALYLHLAPGAHKNYTRGIQDDSHLNSLGALKVATLVAFELEEIQPDVACL